MTKIAVTEDPFIVSLLPALESALGAETIKARVEEARRRFGRPFAHEAGNNWGPKTVPLLTEWMQSRTRLK